MLADTAAGDTLADAGGVAADSGEGGGDAADARADTAETEACAPSCECLFFVDGEASESGDGRGWESAFKTVQEAVNAASLSESRCAVWVKGKPDTGLSYRGNITLSGGLRLHGGFAGHETSLEGRDMEANKTILDAQGTGAVLSFVGGPLRSDEAVVDGFTITGGGASGVRVEHANLLISRCHIVANTALDGGGINAFESEIDVTGSRIEQNTATRSENGTGGNGGGVYVEGGVSVLTRCTFEANAAGRGASGEAVDSESGRPGIDGGDGGAVYAAGASLVVTGSRFTGNAAGSGGNGGHVMAVDGGGSEVVRNRGGDGGSGGDGGAIHATRGSLLVSESSFVGNTAGAGGTGGHVMVLDRGSERERYSGGTGGNGGGGGAIHATGGSLVVSGCSFAGNSAGTGGSGGAGSWYGAGFGGHGGNGGAICSGETSIRVSKSGFAGNNAGAGGTGGAGGVERPEQYAGGEGSAGGGGGAILVTEGSLEVSEASFTDNRAGPGGKGGECCYQEGEQSVGEAGHSGGDGGDGGAVVVAGGTLEATGCRFTGNRAGYGGSATGGWIGGFGGNGGSGGSIFVLGDTRLVGCLIAGGQAGDAGGTTADYPGGHGGLGGGVYSAHGDTVIVGCTITGQGLGGSATSGGYGSALSCSGSSNLVVGSIVYGNKTQPQWPSGEESPQISCDETLDLRHSIVHPEDLDAYGGTGVLTKDPRFVNAAHGDFRLRPDSPCVDTGETAALPTDTADLDGDGDTSEQLPIDLAGAPRVTGEAVDMGAYEYWIGCGNGVVERGEGCDDSNTLDGDRCSANCACESPGAGLGCPVASCAALAGEPGLDDGGYWLSPDVSGEPFKAYCDLSTAGGGWTMVLRLNSNDDHSRGYHSDLFWTYGGEGAAHPYRHRPTGLDDDEDYRAPAYDFLEGWSEILLDYRYAEGQAKRMAAVFSGTSHGSFWSHANQDPRNDNPAWARTFTLSEGEQADAAGWYGPVLKFQTVGDGDDRFIIWFNQAPVDACNQTGGIGVHGRAGDLWWSHELSFPSAMPGCQEDTHRGRIGSNGQPWSGSSLMGEELLSPADAYEHGIMTVLVR